VKNLLLRLDFLLHLVDLHISLFQLGVAVFFDFIDFYVLLNLSVM
jgi:hypothetical protein